jgi:hypothetical protein
MSTVIAPASIAAKPMPFLLQNLFDVFGDMGVVFDEDWDEVVEVTRKTMEAKGGSIALIETDQGQIMMVLGAPLNKEVKNEKTEL